MPQTDIDGTFVYGVTIRNPDSPNWALLCKRLEEVAKAAENDDEKGVSKRKEKSARIERSVFISNSDCESEEEEECPMEDELEDLAEKINIASQKAIDTILAKKDHGLELVLRYAGGDTFDESDPVLVLHHTKTEPTEADVDLGPGSRTFCISRLKSVSEDINENIRFVLSSLGLVADSAIGWQMLVVHSNYY